MLPQNIVNNLSNCTASQPRGPNYKT